MQEMLDDLDSRIQAQRLMRGYILSPTAQEDLVAIRDYYLKEAGYRIARQILAEFVEAFRLIAKNPGIGHKREDLAENRPILFRSMRDYRGYKTFCVSGVLRDYGRTHGKQNKA